MELRQLRYFAKLAELGSFHGAAEALGIAQPTLSQQLKTLERDCGVTLVKRTTHSVSLTEHGQRLLPRVLRILDEVRAARAELSNTSAAARTSLRVGTFGGARVTQFLAAFDAQHPEIELAVRQQSYQETLRLVNAQRLDIGLVQLHPTASVVPAGVQVELVARTRIGVLMRPDHPLARAEQETISLDDLRGERLILTSSNSAPRVAIELAMKTSGVAPDKNPFTTTASATLGEYVSQGLGIGVVADNIIGLVARRLKFRELHHPDITCHIALGSSKHVPRSPSMDAFIEFARCWRWTGGRARR
jgi:DNA-binding transcriptional LysR family regulator